MLPGGGSAALLTGGDVLHLYKAKRVAKAYLGMGVFIVESHWWAL